jgi:N-acetylglutamate synthase-like GNAT family acetyltransferase
MIVLNLLALVRRSREQLEMEIDKFTIIQRDNLTIACAALYPFPEEKIGEMACVAVHPDYRSSSRGEVLLERVAAQARQIGLNKLFVLTTRSIHWFQERGFTPVDIDSLPESKKETPPLPVESRCSTSPEYTIVTVSKPRCGCWPTPRFAPSAGKVCGPA